MSKSDVVAAYQEMCIALAEDGFLDKSVALVRQTAYYRRSPQAWGWREGVDAPVGVDDVTRGLARAFGEISGRELQIWAVMSRMITRAAAEAAEAIPAFGDWDDSWLNDDWTVELGPGQSLRLHTDDILNAIELVQFSLRKGSVLEHHVTDYLGELTGARYTPILKDKHIHEHGPDGFFERGGLALGLPTEAFFVEAKAGDSAINKAVSGIAASAFVKARVKKGDSEKDAYRHYLIDYIIEKHQRDVTVNVAILLFCQSFSFNPAAAVPSRRDLARLFDVVLVRDMFGKITRYL